jgi:hypothetical protein
MYLQIYPIPDHSDEEFVALRGVSVNPQAKNKGAYHLHFLWKIGVFDGVFKLYIFLLNPLLIDFSN